MGSTLALLFIAVTAATGIYVGTRPTVADGRVIEQTIVEGSKPTELTAKCDDRIPIGVSGAVFRCEITRDDGSSASVEYTMNRAGAYSADVLDSSGPTRPSPSRATDSGGDPWN